MEERGFKFREKESIFLSDPFIEENEDRVKIPLFRWIGAGFILEGPKEIISRWMTKNQSSYFEFNNFFNWRDEFEEGVYLQDGCRYFLAGAWYDLEGFGDNGCIIDKDFIEDSFNS